jgi:hypothetical protein
MGSGFSLQSMVSLKRNGSQWQRNIRGFPYLPIQLGSPCLELCLGELSRLAHFLFVCRDIGLLLAH